MADNEDLHSQILKHLTEAQNGLHLHQKLIKSLNNLLVAEDETSPSSSPRVKQFFKAFLPMLRNSLLVLKREPAVERLIEFVAKFSVSVAMKKPARSEEDSSSDEEDEETDETLCQNDFFHILLYQLMEYLDAKEKSVRFRSCQLISKMFTFAFSDPSQESIRISSALSDSLADGLLERLKDRFQLVRLYAVSALGYLQDTSDAACIVTAAIIWSMTHDTSPEVRKCAIVNVLVTKISLPALIERTRDIKDLVRRAAFLKLSESVSIRNLTIDQRVQLANDGLRDESSKVKEAFTGGLLRNWYIELEDDLLQLLRRLDVENCPDVVELVLLSYFEELEDEDLVGSFEASLKRVAGEKEEEEEGGDTSYTHISYVKDCLIPFNDLTCEMVFYWRCLSKYFRSKPEGEGLGFFDRVTPTLSNFCHYFKSYIDDKIFKASSVSDSTLDNELSVEFVGRQLCGMISCLDFTDEMGRRLLDDLIHQLIINPSYPTSLVSCILKEQVQVWPQESYRIERLLDMIAEIRCPSISDSAATSSTITTSQFMNMSTVNLKDDPGSLIKCLAVAGELFRDLRITKLTPPLMTLVESLLLPCIQNENPYVRDMSVFSLGLACLLDVSLARRHILLFIQVIQVDHENVQATSLKVVFDMLHLYGLEAFNLELKPSEEKEEEKEEGKEHEMVKDGEEQKGAGQEEEEEGSTGTITEGLTDNDSTTSGQKFLQILTSYLNGKSTLLREVSAEGISKLLLSGRVVSVPLLVKLLLMWYDPSLHDEDIRTTLGHFFPAYAATDRSYRTSIAEAYIPVMQTVRDAPPTSSLTEVDVTNMSGFIVSLSAPHEPTEDSSHDDLSIHVLNQMLSMTSAANSDDDDDGSYIEWCRLHCHTLTLLKLSPHNTCNNKDVVILVDQLMNSVDDRRCLNSLKKFRNMVDKLLPVTAQVIPECDKENASSEVGVASVAATPTTRSQARHVMSQSQISTRRRRRGRYGNGDDDDEDFSISSTVKKSSMKSSKRKSAKSAAKEKDGRKKGKRKTLEHESDAEESDDSLVGEHSPFVRNRSRPKGSTDPVPSMTSDS